MKKKYLIISISILLVLTTCLYVFMSDNTERVVISNEESKQLMNTNALTMMYETEVGSGEYQVTTDNVWPQDGYVFNEQLSACENGSELTWDEENKRVLVEANTSDKCYVYFDKLSYAIGDQNTMEVYFDESGRLIASAVNTTSPGAYIIEVVHLIILEDITNVNISIRYNPDASTYRGRTTISNYYSDTPLLIDTGLDKYADGEPIIYTGTLKAGDELWLQVVRNNYRLTDSNIDFIMTGDGL